MLTPMTGTDAALVVPQDEAELASFVAESQVARRALRLAGGGTRMVLPMQEGATTLSTQALDGVVTYEPGELTLIARTGTPLEAIERLLASEGQVLAFEPMDHRVLLGTAGTPTLGGVVAANVSGPRRLQAGACRDHLLGVRFVDGRGRVIRNGGRVMKNVTGMDIGKLICGSQGTLGVLTEVALKTLPLAESQKTLAFADVTPAEAVEIFLTALAAPFEVSGAAWHEGTAWLRIEGLMRQVEYRRTQLVGLLRAQAITTLEEEASRHLWQDLRDVRHFAGGTGPIWRLHIRPTEAPAVIETLLRFGGRASMDWGGGLVWYAGEADPGAIRQAVGAGGAVPLRLGAARLLERPTSGVARLNATIRRTFDPAGIFTPGYVSF